MDSEPPRVSTPILVVEDDLQLRVTFQLLLEGEGYPVVAAADGLEAVRAMRISLLILDPELPLLGGQAVAVELRALHGPDLPILIVTATGQQATVADCITPSAYLHEPLDVDGFLTSVWRCLDRSPPESVDTPTAPL